MNPTRSRRAAVIAENYAENVVWHEPDRIDRGRKNLERRAEELRAENPGLGVPTRRTRAARGRRRRPPRVPVRPCRPTADGQRHGRRSVFFFYQRGPHHRALHDRDRDPSAVLAGQGRGTRQRPWTSPRGEGLPPRTGGGRPAAAVPGFRPRGRRRGCLKRLTARFQIGTTVVTAAVAAAIDPAGHGQARIPDQAPYAGTTAPPWSARQRR